MSNPFETIELKLDRIEKILSGKQTEKKSRRLVRIKEYAQYTGQSTNTVYIKLKNPLKVPGAVKIGSIWFFDLDQYDKFISKKLEEQGFK